VTTLLHLVNKSPFERNALDSCLRLAAPGSSILLIEDRVYAALENAAHAEKITGFVDLVAQHNATQSWL